MSDNKDYTELYPELERPAIPAWQLALVKREAVRFSDQSAGRLMQVAGGLGVADQLLYKRRQRARERGALATAKLR